MAVFTDAYENDQINYYLRGQAHDASLPQSANVYCALYEGGDPTETGSGFTEVTGGSYARQQMEFDAPVAGVTQNTNQELFTDMPAVTVTGFGLFTELTGGTLCLFGGLTVDRQVTAGDDFKFNVAAISITLD